MQVLNWKIPLRFFVFPSGKIMTYPILQKKVKEKNILANNMLFKFLIIQGTAKINGKNVQLNMILDYAGFLEVFLIL